MRLATNGHKYGEDTAVRLFRYCMILALAAAGLVTVVPALPAQAASFTLKGDVFAANGQPVLGVTVCALGPTSVCVPTSASASSNDAASCPSEPFSFFGSVNICSVYELDNLPQGSYVLQVKAKPGDYNNSSVFGLSFANFPQAMNLITTTPLLALNGNL